MPLVLVVMKVIVIRAVVVAVAAVAVVAVVATTLLTNGTAHPLPCLGGQEGRLDPEDPQDRVGLDLGLGALHDRVGLDLGLGVLHDRVGLDLGLGVRGLLLVSPRLVLVATGQGWQGQWDGGRLGPLVLILGEHLVRSVPAHLHARRASTRLLVVVS